MESIGTILLVLLIAVAVPMIVLIMIQQGKGADMGAAFGSGSANTFLGSGGASGLLVKLTAGLTVAFFVISFVLAHLARQQADFQNNQGVPEVIAPSTSTLDAESDATIPTSDSDVPVIELDSEE